MIDYDKLKIAHELADKLRAKEDCEITITHTFWGDHSQPYILYIGEPDSYKTDGKYDCLTLDTLIIKLRQLTEQEPVEPGYVSEILEEITPINGVLTLSAGDYICKDGVTYKVKKIDKPEELMRPEPKYQYEQVVWYIDCTISTGPVCAGFVNQMEYREHLFNERKWFVKIEDNSYYIPEECLYPTKAKLIEAQMAYWAKMMVEHDHDTPRFVMPKESEFCNVSGAKLGKKPEGMSEWEYHPPFEGEIKGFAHAVFGQMEPISSIDLASLAKCCDKYVTQKYCDNIGTTGCQHESDGEDYRYQCAHHYKCIKCGEFYR